MLTSRRMQMSFSHELSNTSLEKDTEEKRRAYAAAGIADYWVANLQQGELIVYRQPLEGDYQVCAGPAARSGFALGISRYGCRG